MSGLCRAKAEATEDELLVPMTVHFRLNSAVSLTWRAACLKRLACRAKAQATGDGQQLGHPPGEGKLYASQGSKGREDEPEQADPDFVADYLRKLRLGEQEQASSPDAGYELVVLQMTFAGHGNSHVCCSSLLECPEASLQWVAGCLRPQRLAAQGFSSQDSGFRAGAEPGCSARFSGSWKLDA